MRLRRPLRRVGEDGLEEALGVVATDEEFDGLLRPVADDGVDEHGETLLPRPNRDHTGTRFHDLDGGYGTLVFAQPCESVYPP